MGYGHGRLRKSAIDRRCANNARRGKTCLFCALGMRTPSASRSYRSLGRADAPLPHVENPALVETIRRLRSICHCGLGHWDQLCEFAEVLGGGGEEELAVGTARSS